MADMAPTLVTACTALPPEVYSDRPELVEGWGGPSENCLSPPTSPKSDFSWPVRVYWEDTDAGGIVFYANYLKFFERARTEWLRSLGIEQQRLKDSSGGFFVVIDTHIRYHRPARLDDELIVTASRGQTGGASMIIKQQALLKTEQYESGSSPAGLEAGERREGPPRASSAPSGGILRQAQDERNIASVGALLCEGTIRIGWVNASSLRPAPMPDCILDRLKT